MALVTRVLVVEGQEPSREMLCWNLESEVGIEVVGTAATPAQAVDMAEELAPDIVAMDIDLPGVPNGVDAARTINSRPPFPRIVFFSPTGDHRYIGGKWDVRSSNGSGRARRKSGDSSAVLKAVQGPARDLVAMDPAVAETLIQRRGRTERRLTRRELDVLRLIAKGHNNASISRRLTINEKSVENVVRALYRVLGVSTEGITHPRVTAALSYLDRAGTR